MIVVAGFDLQTIKWSIKGRDSFGGKIDRDDMRLDYHA